MGTVEPQNEVILLVRVRLAANTRKPIPSWLDSHDWDFDDFTRRSPGWSSSWCGTSGLPLVFSTIPPALPSSLCCLLLLEAESPERDGPPLPFLDVVMLWIKKGDTLIF